MNNEQRRYDAALLIFVMQLEAVIDHHGQPTWPDAEGVKHMADAAVRSADALLASLRKEPQ